MTISLSTLTILIHGIELGIKLLDDVRASMLRFSAEKYPKNLNSVNQIVKLAKKERCTAGQLTLAWLMAQGDDTIPIPGTKKIKYLKEDLGALEAKLTEQDNVEI
jgi:aryl-alcohol dehydrogenase-like predicted oxidoreductase